MFADYVLQDRLGEGGMGVVYRALDRRTGRAVALKRVRVTRPGLARSIRREIHTLARLRHPGIVEIFEHGVHEGSPWYAMALIEGQMLGSWLDAEFDVAGRTPPARDQTNWWTATLRASLPEPRPATQPPPERRVRDLGEDVTSPSAPSAPPSSPAPSMPSMPSAKRTMLARLTIARRLCEVLAYLHGEGIVHRDLKPGNILIRPGLEPVIVDFGLAARFGGVISREELALEARVAGTVRYMAPEQIRGGHFDARLDLYALGCVLYELFSGRPPFVADDPFAVMLQHLDARPVPLAQQVSGVPAAVAQLVMRLLEKSPRQRLGYAMDAASTLARLGAQASSTPSPEARIYLHRPRLHGRAEPLARLRSVFDALDEGQGGFVLLRGESGVGKTRLAMEAIQTLAVGRLRPLVFLGAARPNEVRPLNPIQVALVEIIGQCQELLSPAVFHELGDALAQIDQVLHGSGDVDVHGPAPGAAPSPQVARRARLSALSQILQALARERPVVLVIDDLQWADTLTVAFLCQLFEHRVWRHTRLVVVATCRNEHHERLEPLLGRSGLQIVELRRLDEASLADMLGDMLALSRAPGELVSFVVQHSEGNAFFAAELLRAVVEGDLLRRSGDGQWQLRDMRAAHPADDASPWNPFQLPQSLFELIAQRFARLPADARAILEAAAVSGHEVLLERLHRVTGLSLARFFEGLDELRRRQLIEELEGTYLRFSHSKILEAVVATLSPDRSAALHRATATALAASQGTAADENLAALAYHLGEVARLVPDDLEATLAAVDYSTRFARWALQGGAFDEPLQRVAFALGLMERVPLTMLGLEQRLEVLQLLASIQMIARGYGRATDTLERALEVARSLADRGREFEISWGLWLNHLMGGRMSSTREYERRLHTLAGESQQVMERLQALHASWTRTTEVGELTAALRHIEEGTSLYAEVADGEERLRWLGGHETGMCCYKYWGIVSTIAGMPDTGIERHRRSLELAGSHPPSLVNAEFFMALSLCERGDREQAAELLERQIARAKRHSILEFADLGAFVAACLRTTAAPHRGVAELESFLVRLDHPASKAALVRCLPLAARALLRVGHLERADHFATLGLENSRETGLALYDAEYHRLRGLAGVALERPVEEVERELQAAQRIARVQGARLFALRAAIARLRWRPDDQSALATLRQIHDDIAEGHHLADMRAAAALLES